MDLLNLFQLLDEIIPNPSQNVFRNLPTLIFGILICALPLIIIIVIIIALNKNKKKSKQ